MKEYLLLSKGDHDKWEKMSPEANQELHEKFRDWVDRLEKRGRWVRGNGLPRRSLVVRNEEGEMVIEEAAISKTHEGFTGVFIIKAKDPVEATELAKECPTLLYDEVFVLEMGEK